MADSSTRTTDPTAPHERSEKDNTPARPKVKQRPRPKVEVVKAVNKKGGATKLSKLMAYLDSIRGQNFTGYIKVNFSQGAIGRVERFEEILRK